MSTSLICCKSAVDSGSWNAPNTTGVPGNSRISAAIVDCCADDNCLGALNFSNASCASDARAFASAMAAREASASEESLAASLFKPAILSKASAASLFATSACNSRFEVRHSDWASRMPVALHCSRRNPIVAQAPIAVITPAINRPFQETGYQYSAQPKSDWEIGEGAEPTWFSMAIACIVATPAAPAGFTIVFYGVGNAKGHPILLYPR